jgi:chromosome segregation ATPase
MKILFSFSLLFCVGCGVNSISENPDLSSQTKINSYESIKFQLDELIDSNFNKCSEVKPKTLAAAFCTIASNSSLEQISLLKEQVSNTITIITDSLYGENCSSKTDENCPSPTSLVSQIDNNSTSISVINSNLLTLSNKIDLINNRLNSFNGTNKTIEVIISELDSDLISLKNEITIIKEKIKTIEEMNRDVNYMVSVCSQLTLSEYLIKSTSKIWEPFRGKLRLLKTIEDGTEIFKKGKCNYKIYKDLRICFSSSTKFIPEDKLDELCNNNEPDCVCQ